MTFRQRLLRWPLVLLLTLLVTSCTAHSQSSSSAWQRLAATQGATLDRIRLETGSTVYLQTLDLRQVVIEQLIGPADPNRGTKGFYYPSQNKFSSPFFPRQTATAIRNTYQQQHPSGIFSILNAAFFEEYQRSTRLSFPIKHNGKVITSGSSPYGPTAKPADPYYRTVRLKALTWDASGVAITDYMPRSGFPLTRPSVQNALVSYAYRDHPAYALAGDPPNRYHVLGVLSLHKGAKAHELLIATIERGTLAQAATVLRQQGVQGDLMTIDGGISTYLWSATAGDLVLPQPASGEKESALPHYLGIRAKSGQP
jgi:hypothetical protein